MDSNAHGRVSGEALAAFEQEWGPLPGAYRRHLVEHNGGRVEGESFYGELYGLHGGPPGTTFPPRAQLSGHFPDGQLPIGSDPGGNLVCLDLGDGHVGVWDHEAGTEPTSITFLANDFDRFLRGLAIKVAVRRNRRKELSELLDGVAPDEPVLGTKSTFDLAIEAGKTALARQLASPNTNLAPDALIEAVRSGRRDAVELLLARGVDVNHMIPETGFTALMLASSRNLVQIAERLLECGADPMRINSWGRTAIELAHSDEMRAVFSRPR